MRQIISAKRVEAMRKKVAQIKGSKNPRRNLVRYLNSLKGNERSVFLREIGGTTPGTWAAQHIFKADGKDRVFEDLYKDVIGT